MINKRIVATALFILSLVVSCSQVPAHPTDKITIDLGNNTNNLARWHVIGRTDVEISLNNPRDDAIRWAVLTDPLQTPYKKEGGPKIYVEFQVKPQTTLEKTFLAPAAPGEYDVVQTVSGLSGPQLIGKIIVVQLQK